SAVWPRPRHAPGRPGFRARRKWEYSRYGFSHGLPPECRSTCSSSFELWSARIVEDTVPPPGKWTQRAADPAPPWWRRVDSSQRTAASPPSHFDAPARERIVATFSSPSTFPPAFVITL